MLIEVVKYTTIAYAPDEIVKAINRYTDHTAYVTDLRVNKLHHKGQPDIIHWNNKFDVNNTEPCIIQYHSEPSRVQIRNTGVNLVVAQYQCLLPEYKHCIPIRNVINFEDPVYQNIVKPKDHLVIAYSPSTTKKINQHFDKGYQQTTTILNTIKRKYPEVEIDIITGVSLNECLKRKSRAHIVIDECVTGSYHRCTLEGLALSAIVIVNINMELWCYLDSNKWDMPINSITLGQLEFFVSSLFPSDIHSITNRGKRNQKWMQKNWHPKDIASEYITHYENAIKEHNNAD